MSHRRPLFRRCRESPIQAATPAASPATPAVPTCAATSPSLSRSSAGPMPVCTSAGRSLGSDLPTSGSAGSAFGVATGGFAVSDGLEVAAGDAGRVVDGELDGDAGGCGGCGVGDALAEGLAVGDAGGVGGSGAGGLANIEALPKRAASWCPKTSPIGSSKASRGSPTACAWVGPGSAATACVPSGTDRATRPAAVMTYPTLLLPMPRPSVARLTQCRLHRSDVQRAVDLTAQPGHRMAPTFFRRACAYTPATATHGEHLPRPEYANAARSQADNGNGPRRTTGDMTSPSYRGECLMPSAWPNSCSITVLRRSEPAFATSISESARHSSPPNENKLVSPSV
ncbi:hypothetical protein BJ958_004308 [Nocardioides kongjuensis]|uniref:Uncharacterized protein n=1 Tax=Nocardioides kongjuensis TaxID=349522 RepID=A0A852S1R1_9ACTN|nr:hypothetical protein [Nocardioides kongjuensis]